MSATTALVLHKGAREVTLDQLKEVKPPPPDGRWVPLAHGRVLEVVGQTLSESGYLVKKMKLGLSPDGHRFFGTLDLMTDVALGVTLAVGIRSSTDKTFPLGFCAGSRVFVCDNLAFRSELLVRRKHTTNGERNFISAIASAVGSLQAFKEAEAERITRFATTHIGPNAADALILRAFEKGIVGVRDLPKVLRAWRTPRHEEFRERTVWSLFNAFTEALKDRVTSRPSEFALQTMRLHALLDQEQVVPAVVA